MPASNSPSGEPVTYLAYLEETAHRLTDGEIEGPGGAPLAARPQVLSQPCLRARFSGIRAADLEPLMGIVELLPDGELSEVQRERRRTELNSAFERIPVPVIDLLWPAPDPAGRKRWPDRALRGAEGRWFELRATRGAAVGASRLIFVGEPEPGRPIDDFGAGELVGIRPVDPGLTDILRNIFSLAHIGDAGSGEEPEEPGAAPPPEGDDGPSGVELKLVREDETVVEDEIEIERFRIQTGSRRDEGPQHVTVSN